MRMVRFRTLGCYPLSAAMESTATTIAEIVQETQAARTSERQGRLIDHDQAASMEKKKQEGLFLMRGHFALHYLRQRRRWQVHTHRKAAMGVEASVRRSGIGAGKGLNTLRHARRQVDLALLVDGLQAEREQSITIDVAYRFFATPRRRFMVADTPGHEQYTRNMATGASTSELAVLVVNATKGPADPDPPARANRSHAGHSASGHGREQNGPGRIGTKLSSRESSRRFEPLIRELGFESFQPSLSPRCTATTSSGANASAAWYTGPALLKCFEEIDVSAR